MSIKNVKPSGKFKGSKYKPVNEEKYIGPGPIICRSSWERKYCMYCDRTTSIVQWASEPFGIDYYNPLTKKMHKYYPDFWLKLKKKDGSFKQYLIEIKPKNQIKRPKEPKRKTAQAVKNYTYKVKEYIRNDAKAKAARAYAKDRDMNYMILTEDTIR